MTLDPPNQQVRAQVSDLMLLQISLLFFNQRNTGGHDTRALGNMGQAAPAVEGLMNPAA